MKKQLLFLLLCMTVMNNHALSKEEEARRAWAAHVISRSNYAAEFPLRWTINSWNSKDSPRLTQQEKDDAKRSCYKSRDRWKLPLLFAEGDIGMGLLYMCSFPVFSAAVYGILSIFGQPVIEPFLISGGMPLYIGIYSFLALSWNNKLRSKCNRKTSLIDAIETKEVMTAPGKKTN
jgi:hypothetical protein